MHEGVAMLPSGGALLWDVALVRAVRRLRIVGREIGALPAFHLQNQVHGLPVALLPEEVALCRGLLGLEEEEAGEGAAKEVPLAHAVFADLHRREYWVTEGFKFGGDFLAYRGDPLVYHSSLIVLVKEWHEATSTRQIQVATRMATTVKKRCVIASRDEQGVIRYIKVAWKGVT